MILRSILRFIGHQQWLRFGIRDRIIRNFHNPDTCSVENFQVSFFGYIYQGNLKNFLDWSVYYFGTYSGEELHLIKDALRNVQNPVLLDVGANVGHHSLFASTIATEVHAFEPFPDVKASIYEKIKANSINNITVHEVGLGNTNENLPYFMPQDNNTGTGTFTNGSSQGLPTILLPIRIGDEYLDELKLPKLDYIKMDIEGFEPQALQGLKHTLESHRPIVFFEWSANERNIIIDPLLLFPDQYKIFSFISNQPILGVFNKQSYELNKEVAPYKDGNKVAVPVELEKRLSSRIK